MCARAPPTLAPPSVEGGTPGTSVAIGCPGGDEGRILSPSPWKTGQAERIPESSPSNEASSNVDVLVSSSGEG